MIVTREFIEEGKSDRGGWSRRQIMEIGGQWPLRAGWMKALVGTEITERQAQQFMALRNGHMVPGARDLYRESMQHMRNI